MPIYAYRCSSCGHQQDVLHKHSDAPLTVCPTCGQATFNKQLSAPAFQLKGTGWYVTDFRDNKRPAKDKEAQPSKDGAAETATAAGDKGESGAGKGADPAAGNGTGKPGAKSDAKAGTTPATVGCPRAAVAAAAAAVGVALSLETRGSDSLDGVLGSSSNSTPFTDGVRGPPSPLIRLPDIGDSSTSSSSLERLRCRWPSGELDGGGTDADVVDVTEGDSGRDAEWS